MARISAHGETVGTIEFTASARRYMSDGVILVNKGFGWKIYGKVKPGFDVAAVFSNKVESQKAWEAAHPASAAYRRAVHDLCGLGKRWKLHLSIQMMPDDFDGVWSECCDGYGDNIHADVDEIAAVCRLYQAAVREQRGLEASGQYRPASAV